MSLTNLSAHEPGPEAPTAFAELKIEVDPARPRGSANGKVLPGQAHDLVTTFGVLGSVIAGIAGAVLTLRRSPRLIAPAFAELALAGTSAVLIATRRAADRRTAGTRRSLERQMPSTRTETSLASGNSRASATRGKQVLRIGGVREQAGIHSRDPGRAGPLGRMGLLVCACRTRRSSCICRPPQETLPEPPFAAKNCG